MRKVDFDFTQYIRSMSEQQLQNFAIASGTTTNYIKLHLIYKKKIPRPEMIDSLVIAAEGGFSKHQFVSWLYDLEVA